MSRKEINTDRAPAAVGPYSQAVTAGNFVYTSGSIPFTPEGQLVPGGVTEQAEQIFINLKEVLAAAGATYGDVIKANCYLQDMNDFEAFNEVYARQFPDFKPARTTVEVSRLPKDVLVEVELIAFKD